MRYVDEERQKKRHRIPPWWWAGFCLGGAFWVVVAWVVIHFVHKAW